MAPNRRLGNLNAEIYKLGAFADVSKSGLRDVTSGNNGFNKVPGYNAGPGYYLPTGWGTPDITTFVNAYTSDVCPECAQRERR